MSETKAVSHRAQQTHISEPDAKALKSEGVKSAVQKLATDIKNGAGKDQIESDKKDAFSKYQAAGGQAKSMEAFGEEASHTKGSDRKQLREAFGLPKEHHAGHTPGGGAHGGGTADKSGAARDSSSLSEKTDEA